MNSNEAVHVGHALFFDDRGCGPDPVVVSVQPVQPIADIPNSGGLGLIVAVPKGEFAMLVKDGGFFMKRDTAAELHRKLGEWLGHASEHNATIAPAATHASADGSLAGWSWSDDEERWSGSDRFETREAAIAEAIETLDGGQKFWTGLAVPVSVESTADALLGNAEDTVGQWLYDNVGEDFADEFAPSKEQLDDLTSVVRGWLTKHGLTPKVWTVEHVQRHAVPTLEEAL